MEERRIDRFLIQYAQISQTYIYEVYLYIQKSQWKTLNEVTEQLTHKTYDTQRASDYAGRRCCYC